MLLTYPTYSTWRIAQLEGVEEGISRKARMKLAAPGAPAAYSSAGRRPCAANWQ